MSIYGDLDVHGNINIIDKYGSNYNFRLSNLGTLPILAQYIKTDETTSTQNPNHHYDSGLSSLNNDIRLNLTYLVMMTLILILI